MKRWLLVSIGLLVLALSASVGLTMPTLQTAPTLVPPTLVPTVDPGIGDVLVTESAVAHIQSDGVVRVGILYNAPPFSVLNVRGEVSGFDADLAKALADAWGVKVEFTQITRQTGIDMLRNGQVDVLMGAQVHRRELDSLVDFSQTYYMGSQAMMVRADDGATALGHMANRKVAVILGTSGEQAVADWLKRSNLPVTVVPYVTLDQAFVALVNKDVDGVVDSRIRLTNNITRPDLIRLLDEPVASEPYAVVVRRQDVSLRNLINCTLQYLVQTGNLQKIYKTYFPSVTFPDGVIQVWAGVGDDAPKPNQFASEIAYPAQYAAPRVLNNKVLRIAGMATLPDDATESQRRLDTLNRALIEKMAARWGVTVQYIPDSVANAADLIATSQADIAVGMQPDWGAVDKIDFTAGYVLHGERLLVQKNSQIAGFADLRGGKWIAIMTDEPTMQDQAAALANSVNARVQFYSTREQDVALTILSEKNADVAFGDSLKLIPHVQTNPDALELTKTWYSREYIAFAVPRNDPDFRMLVEYTLQEIAREGTLNTLLQPVMLPDEIPSFEVWPGSSQYMGLSLAGS